MSDRDVVIRVEGVSKLYRLGEVGTGSIKVKGRIASLLEVGTGFHPELTGSSEVGFALHGPSREPEGWEACRMSNQRLARRAQRRREGASQNIFLNGAARANAQEMEDRR